MALNCSVETNVIDSKTVSIKYIVGGWLTLIFCISGTITNIFTIVVLLHPRMRNSSTHVYLLALSVCNIFLLAGLTINYSVKSIASYPELLSYLYQPDTINRNALHAHTYEQFYARVAPFTTPLLSMLLLCSTYLTVLVSGDRYFLICWPLLAEKIRTRKMALRSVLLVFVLVNIYIFPHWFEYRTAARDTKRSMPTDNSTSNESEVDDLVELTYTRLGSNAIYLSIYRFYLNVPITFVIPFTLLTLCNGSMIHQLLLIKKNKKRLGHRMKADIRITIMLIVIVLTFMLCRSINIFANLLVQLSPCLNRNSIQRVNTFANLLIAFNGFVNFFLFAAFGQRFREMVLYIFFRHGQYPFPTHHDGASTHRFAAAGVPSSADMLRRQSRRFSATENDVWAAIARRRSSASMATLYNSSDTRHRTLSSSSHLQVLPPLKSIRSASTDMAQSPLLKASNQQSSASDNHSFTVGSNHHHQENTSIPSSMRTRTFGIDTQAPATLHVTFV